MDKKQITRNKICFGLGTVGRDALYSLISMYLLVYLNDVVIFSKENSLIIGGVLTAFGIFDAVIDPLVGAIVDKTRTRWGKFKPWILIGMIGTGFLTVAMFHNIEMDEITHIVLLCISYLLFSIFFSLNDIAYWSLMPALSKDQKERESIGSFARICASVGMFAMVLIYPEIPKLFAGFGLDRRTPYFITAVIVAIIMWAFQSITLVGVKEDRSHLQKSDNTSLKDLFGALLHNDQLMVTALSMVLFMIGYCTTTGLGYQYFEYVYKDTGVYIVFAAVLAVAQLTALSVFPLFRKKFTRKQLYTGAMVSITISYLLFFLSAEFLPIIVIAGLGLFFGQAFIQLLMLLFLADAVEYGEWKIGRRNEAASFAVQPFINQFGGAVSKGIVSLALFFSGITTMLNAFEDHLNINGITDLVQSEAIKHEFINNLPPYAGWVLKFFMMIIPLIFILASFIIYYRKFKIDEELYAKIVSDLDKKNGVAAPAAEYVDKDINHTTIE